MADRRPVLIVSTPGEPSVEAVAAQLDRMAVPWHLLDRQDVPLLRTIGWTVGAEGPAGWIDGADGRIALDAVRSRWFRRMVPPVLPSRLAPHDRLFAEGEVAATLQAAVFAEDGPFAVNPRAAERRATNKLHQLRVAREVGLAVPETLVTNDPDAVRRFVAAADEPVIFKPVSGAAPTPPDLAADTAARFAGWGAVTNGDLPPRGEREMIFAQLLDAEKLAAIDGVRLSPVAFQHFVAKVADVRVTIVGREMFACRIRSQDRAATSVDFRRMVLIDDGADVVHEACTLPRDTEAALSALMARLGLVFGCVDLVEAADGTLTFLEVNPAGQWLWIEHRTGQPIGERLAAMLAAGAD